VPDRGHHPGRLRRPRERRLAPQALGRDSWRARPRPAQGPNVFYREVAPAGIDPLKTSDAGGHLWAARHPAIAIEPREFDALEAQARARTTYDVAHPPLWGWKISAYLLTKAIAAGAFLAAISGGLWPLDSGPPQHTVALAVPLLALAFLAVTSLLLVADLKRPERFLLILLHPNHKSWLVRGTWALMGYGTMLAFLVTWTLIGGEPTALRWSVPLLTAFLAALSAAYTGWLFGQAKGRVLWMQQGLWLRLVLQAFTAGAALWLVLAPWLRLDAGQRNGLAGTLIVTLGLNLFYTTFERMLAPRGRAEEYARTLALIHRGPFAKEHAIAGLLLGTILPIPLLILGGPPTMALAALCALYGLWVEKSLLVRAGQALPIS
jgi:formate-dependent nitrite reductase membrane component NrfD